MPPFDSFVGQEKATWTSQPWTRERILYFPDIVCPGNMPPKKVRRDFAGWTWGTSYVENRIEMHQNWSSWMLRRGLKFSGLLIHPMTFYFSTQLSNITRELETFFLALAAKKWAREARLHININASSLPEISSPISVAGVWLYVSNSVWLDSEFVEYEVCRHKFSTCRIFKNRSKKKNEERGSSGGAWCEPGVSTWII